MNGVSSIMTSSWRHNDIRFFGTLGENVEEVKLSKYTKFHAFIIICTIIPFPSHNSPDYVSDARPWPYNRSFTVEHRTTLDRNGNDAEFLWKHMICS